MSNRVIRQFAVLVVCAALASPLLADNAVINFERCQVEYNAVERDAECGTLLRPENPGQNDGNKISLFVIRFPSHSAKPAADAFTLIQGGPGGSSIDLGVSYYPLLDTILAKRDVLIVDQRGTGRSHKLACPSTDEDVELIAFDPQKSAEFTQRCLQALTHADLRFYTSSVAVQDLDAVRAAAGYQQLTVYGVSYGTRVAQHYLRRFPDQTRALILDGVAHIGLNLAGGEIARRSQAAFDNLARRCQESNACRQESGDLTSHVARLRERLRSEPQQVELAHPDTGNIVTETVGEQHLLAVMRMLPYATEGLALLPLLISAAESDNLVPLAARVLMLNTAFSDEFALGMQNSVMCTEDYPFVNTSDVDDLDQTFFGSTLSDAFDVTCKAWPQGAMDEDFRQSFDSDKPVLILSGETDPITPPENGARTEEMFSNARHVVVPSHGHGVFARGCVAALASEFVVHANLSELDTQCTQRERAEPFFVNPTGPLP